MKMKIEFQKPLDHVCLTLIWVKGNQNHNLYLLVVTFYAPVACKESTRNSISLHGYIG